MLYSFCRRVLFSMQPETAHRVTMANLDWAVHFGLHKLLAPSPAEDPVHVMGLRFPNSVGLAAGMDKNGTRVSAFGGLGFGHVEVGTVTPLAQPGNPKPRCFRVIPAQAIINRMGFNNEGTEKVLQNLRSADAFALRGGILGINIGKNTATPMEAAVQDYEKALAAVYARADYVAVNVSCPNLAGLCDLQDANTFDDLVKRLAAKRSELSESQNGRRVPLVMKLSPDLSDDALLRCTDTLLERGFDGVIATNTTTDRHRTDGLPNGREAGGLSGAPLRDRSTACIRLIAEHTKGTLPVIASGGILSADDAVEKMEAGASLIQLYTGFIYHGPALITACSDAVARWRREQKSR